MRPVCQDRALWLFFNSRHAWFSHLPACPTDRCCRVSSVYAWLFSWHQALIVSLSFKQSNLNHCASNGNMLWKHWSSKGGYNTKFVVSTRFCKFECICKFCSQKYVNAKPPEVLVKTIQEHVPSQPGIPLICLLCCHRKNTMSVAFFSLKILLHWLSF